ncbi:MAG: hypothetical protein K1Y36_15935 [Blastocatellia bacterium]|nr:hypothetical protein [Blastocatellia bacterium]
MKTQTKIKWQAFGILACVFGLGAITGAVVSNRYAIQAQPGPISVQVTPLRDEQAYFQHLERELRLSPAQTASIRTILNRTGMEYSNVCAEVRPRYDALRNQTRESVRAVLSKEQQHRFDQLVVQENCSSCPINVFH